MPASHRSGGRHGSTNLLKQQNTNKSQLLASNYDIGYGTFQSLVFYENFNPKTDRSLRSLMRQAA